MGDYTLLIHGTGRHHGTRPVDGKRQALDADGMLERFVKELKENGHVVEVATITHGGRESILAD